MNRLRQTWLPTMAVSALVCALSVQQAHADEPTNVLVWNSPATAQGGATLPNRVWLSVSLSNPYDGPLSVQFLMDSVPLAVESQRTEETELGQTQYLAVWDTRLTAPGLRRLGAVATSMSGTVVAVAPALPIEVPTLRGPVVRITTPDKPAYVTSTFGEYVAVEARDYLGLQRIDLLESATGYVFGTATYSAPAPPYVTHAEYAAYFPASSFGNGRKQVRVNAVDRQGLIDSDYAFFDVEIPGLARFEHGGVPWCPAGNATCTTGDVTNGRSRSGSEIFNQPSTVDGCQDGQATGASWFLVPPAVQKLTVETFDGTAPQEGKLLWVRAEAVGSFNPVQPEYVDIFYASDSANPSWRLLRTFRLVEPPFDWYTASVMVDSLGPPVFRAQARQGGSAVPCQGATKYDVDDLVVHVLPDDLPPDVNLQSPNGDVQAFAPFQMRADASDNLGTVKVGYFVDERSVGSSNTPPFSALFDTRFHGDGRHVVYARATDARGNSAVTPRRTVTVRNDVTAPKVQWLTPQARSQVIGTASLQVTASDDVGVAYVEFYVGSSFIGRLSQAPYSMSWNTAGLRPRSYMLQARVVDVSGKTSSASVPVMVGAR